MEFSKELKSALNQVSQEIAPDAKWADGEEMAEMCVDARRLEMAGFKAEQTEARLLIDRHGYGEFLKEAAKHILGGEHAWNSH
ncbi:MAG: hypothetical protein Unbinned200contig1000_74 [Prokaryotic dsDNA virus sp.]|jgi:hypothetical protein|nr:hypothetical protein [Flavobacteriaceae bacterium]QDP65334.1 MAG: hypothetical protein Unbinned200contig1000_74 [Prokaryotic dsDNA virus sp.]|tara:strand:+ start:9276 stop:9524 length:249 start_codon:yes stop_codon:yes gene_type:complete